LEPPLQATIWKRSKPEDVHEVAEVLRNLYLKDKKKGLSMGEKKMLDKRHAASGWRNCLLEESDNGEGKILTSSRRFTKS